MNCHLSLICIGISISLTSLTLFIWKRLRGHTARALILVSFSLFILTPTFLLCTPTSTHPLRFARQRHWVFWLGAATSGSVGEDGRCIILSPRPKAKPVTECALMKDVTFRIGPFRVVKPTFNPAAKFVAEPKTVFALRMGAVDSQVKLCCKARYHDRWGCRRRNSEQR